MESVNTTKKNEEEYLKKAEGETLNTQRIV